jgi:hypothetical protein
MVNPNGAAAYCTSGAGYITVKLKCHVAGWETYMRYGPRVWSNAQDPSSAVSKVYCDSSWHDLQAYGFDVG